jgi:hypothetical protein
LKNISTNEVAKQLTGHNVMVGPNHYTKLKHASNNPQPKTALGEIAQQLSQQTGISMLNVTATTAYVYALGQSAAPKLTFTSVPSGMTSTVAELQTAYDTFVTQLIAFQTQADAWVPTTSGGGTCILSDLLSVPASISNVNGTVTTNFTLLSTLPSSSPAYQKILTTQKNDIGAESTIITNLVYDLTTLGENLDAATNALITSTKTGTLSQLTAAYQTDIAKLDTAMTAAQNTISSANAKIKDQEIIIAASSTVAAVGAANWWNPVGWGMMAGGAISDGVAISKINVLKAQIDSLNSAINTDVNFSTADQAAASVLSIFCILLQGFATMNTAAQQELTALAALYASLGTDITEALTDLTANDIADAQTEWEAIVTIAKPLENLTVYLQPSPDMLSSPSPFAAVNNDIYVIAASGTMFHYSAGVWKNMEVTALSCVGQGPDLVAIDGAPIAISAAGISTSTSTYFVKSYNMSTAAWTTISNFPAAAVAVGGSKIYAISQVTADRQVYQYSGSGSTWTALAALPGPDAAIQIAVANGVVFALTNNSRLVYQYNATNSTWGEIGDYCCSSIQANGTKLAIVGLNNYSYLYDPSVGGSPVNTGAGVTQVAQLVSGDEYRIGMNQDLWFFDSSTPFTWTYVAENVTAVFASDTDQTYYTTFTDDLYSLNSSNVSTKLPAMPTF